MRYRNWAPALLAVPALALAACGGSTTPSTASGGSSPSSMSGSGMSGSGMSSSPSAGSGMMTSGSVTLMKIKTGMGAVLANAKGMTLYWYADDTPMASKCTGGCATAWPPVEGKPDGAMGIKFTGKFGTVSRPGGALQATYKGHPLYTYSGDMAPGQTKGNGIDGGAWHVLKVSLIGAVSPSMVMTSSSPSPAASSMGGGYGGGGGY